MTPETVDEGGEEERQALREAGGVLVQSSIDALEIWDFGEHDEEEDDSNLLAKTPLFRDAHPELVGGGAGQVRLLYQAANRVMGQQLDIGPQRWQDCVSWGVGGAIDLRACVEVEENAAEHYSWDERVCTEALQALAAYEHNSGRGWTNCRLGAIAARDGGTLSRASLGPYSAKRAKKWAKSGLPDKYEPTALKHRIRDVSRITSFEEARDAIQAGLPAVVGSHQAFVNRGLRDVDGFAKPSTKKKWKHCMKFVGMRDDERPGLLCLNSWKPNGGPKGKYSDIPDGSFWVDPVICNKMFDFKRTFAIGSFEGYVAQTQQA